MTRYDKYSSILAILCFAGASLGDDCDDDDKKSKDGVKVAQHDPPTPEMIAGMGDGALKICVTPKADVSELPLIITFPEQSELKPVQLALKKTEKGYCEYWRGEVLSRLWWNGLQLGSPAELSEIGVYFEDKYKENPKADDLKYAKAERQSDGSYRINVRVITETPHIEVHSR